MDIRLEDVSCRRGGRDVLGIPSLSIASGRVTAVLGPNGAGKTTLLRLIAGLDRPYSGKVLVGGETADARRRCVSYLFQEQVFLRQSLLDNLELGLQLHGASDAEARERAIAGLQLLGIESLADRRADQISGGEGRRASLARALSLASPVLLLDEPMAGLDGRTYTRLLDELPPLLGAFAATTVVVTHDREEAFRLCDDVVILVGGRVRAVGTKQEVATNPRHREVAEVLGYTVLTAGGCLVATPETGFTLAPAPTALSAVVERVTDVVDHWEVVATIGETRVHVRAPRSDTPPTPGDHVWLRTSVMYELS
ncbi:MAG TPA: ATP-binding cassette domain-containing protein [Vicinamibacterales bacterium]|nr:ATP-binding cassette domain-containing protein [Vicinamibacterales bacterium]